MNRTVDRIRQLLTPEQREQIRLYIADPQPECSNKVAGVSLLGCNAGMNHVAITCDGKLLGCQMLGDFHTNALHLGFAEAWKQWPCSVRLPQLNRECTTCSHIDSCAVCPAVRMAECGDLAGRPDYICQQTKLLAKKKGVDLL